jgi:hypothetical protein
MPKQVCFTADDELIAAIDEIVGRVHHSRSDVTNILLWSAVRQIEKDKVNNFGDLMRVSAGTAITFKGGQNE